MKGLVLVLMMLTSSVALNRFASPSELERDAAQWLRKTRQEQERMTKEMLMMRNNINHQLEAMEKQVNEGTNTGQDLESLRTRIENENRELQQLSKETNTLTRAAWNDAKVRAEKQLIQVKREYLHVQKKMEQAISSNDKK